MSHPALHEGELEMQRRHGVLEAGGRVAAGIYGSIPPAAKGFLARQPFAVAAVLDAEERPWAALWSGEPGFLEIQGERRVMVPSSSFDALTHEAMVLPNQVGMISIDLESRRRMRLNGFATAKPEGLVLNANEVYGNCPKFIQKRRLERHFESPHEPTRGIELSDRQRAVVSASDTFFVASSNPGGGADASHRGGEPGFVRWHNERTLEFYDFAGNNLFNTLGNLFLNPRIGLLFIDFEKGDILQLTGHSELLGDSPELTNPASWKRSLVRVDIEQWQEQRGAMPWRGPLLESSPFNPPLE